MLCVKSPRWAEVKIYFYFATSLNTNDFYASHFKYLLRAPELLVMNFLMRV